MNVNNKKIEEKFAKSQNALVLQQSDLSLKSISDMVSDGSIDISPKYQRRERWNELKESGLIESFLLNIPVPPIYLAEDEYGTYSVIDGKQRLIAINKFLKDELKLKKLEKFPELEGIFFSALPTPLSNALKIRPYLRVVTLLRQSDSDLKHEVFLRLNKAGVALNSQEIRNVAFRGGFNDLLFKLSENEYFVQQLGSKKGTKIYEEMTDVQFVLRFFTVKEYWKEFPGNMDVAMDRFMSAHYKLKDDKISERKQEFLTALNFVKEIWGKDAFMKPNASKRILQGFYDIEMVCASLLNEAERKKAVENATVVRQKLDEALKFDLEFLESVTQFTSNPRNVFYRINKFTDLLKEI